MTFLIFLSNFFLSYVLFRDWNLLLYCCLNWNLCGDISWWRRFLRLRLLWWFTLAFLFKWWKLAVINHFIGVILIFFFRLIFICLLFDLFTLLNLHILFAWFVFVVLILLILFLHIFISIFKIFFITFDISSNLNPFDFTFVNCCICFTDFNLTLKRVAFYSTSWTFSSLVADVDTLMNNSFLFLFFRFWIIITPWLIILFGFVLLLLHSLNVYLLNS